MLPPMAVLQLMGKGAEVGGDVGDLDFTTPNGSDDRTLKKASCGPYGCFVYSSS